MRSSHIVGVAGCLLLLLSAGCSSSSSSASFSCEDLEGVWDVTFDELVAEEVRVPHGATNAVQNTQIHADLVFFETEGGGVCTQ